MKDVVAAAIFNTEHELLLCRKATLDYYIFPGGKLNPGESNINGLKREIFEELHCEISSTFALKRFINKSPKGDPIKVCMYHTILIGEPIPCAELVELYWYKPGYVLNYPLTPTSHEVIFYLASIGAFSGTI